MVSKGAGHRCRSSSRRDEVVGLVCPALSFPPFLRRDRADGASVPLRQALSWGDEDDTGVDRAKALRIVVLKYMFHPVEARVRGGGAYRRSG
jgi:hypothetical protein